MIKYITKGFIYRKEQKVNHYSLRIMVFVFMGVLFLSVSFVCAEAIVLKSGKTIEGKLLEKTDEYIKIDFQGVPLRYYFDEIDSIDGVKQSPSSVEAKKLSQENNLPAVYTNPAKEYLKLGVACYNQGNLSQAILDYNKAIEIDPTLVAAYYDRGFTYYKNANYEQAISDYTKAIEINPIFAYAYEGRAYAYFTKKEYKKAWTDVHEAERFGYKADKEDLEFLDKLKKASGRNG